MEMDGWPPGREWVFALAGLVAFLVFVALLGTSCDDLPTRTPVPTWTLWPTATLIPTSTPRPTAVESPTPGLSQRLTLLEIQVGRLEFEFNYMLSLMAEIGGIRPEDR